MQEIEGSGGHADPITVVGPTIRGAQSAVRSLLGRWGRAPLVAMSLRAFLTRRGGCSILLCPEGRKLVDDLAFLRRVRARILWPPPEGDLRAAIAGLRGEDLPPLPSLRPSPRGQLRKSALLLEGAVTGERARAALASETRHWIVESPCAVALTARQLEALARRGVQWSALQPVRVVALLASPALARGRRQWRHLLPRRTKVCVWRGGALSP
jgi:hypothetical protein